MDKFAGVGIFRSGNNNALIIFQKLNKNEIFKKKITG
jgi:hypothetical protein